MEIDQGDTQSHIERDSISASPTSSKHALPAAIGIGEDLPSFEPPSPFTDSPQAERLPFIPPDFTGSLPELAEAATQGTQEPTWSQDVSHTSRPDRRATAPIHGMW